MWNTANLNGFAELSFHQKLQLFERSLCDILDFNFCFKLFLQKIHQDLFNVTTTEKILTNTHNTYQLTFTKTSRVSLN